MRLKIVLVTALLVAFCLGGLLLQVGCTREGKMVSPKENDSGPGGDRSRLETTVELYFASLKAVETGEHSPFTGYTAPIPRRVPHNEDTALLLQAVMEALIKGPRPEEAGVGPVMPPTARILSITVVDGVATIDFSRELLTDSAGGTLGGAVFMDAVILTATQFTPVNHVQVLVEGEPWNDGHFVWDKPLGRYEILPAS